MDYLKWNNAIASRIFHEGMEDKPVLLGVDSELIEEIGDKGDFIRACQEGPSSVKVPPKGLGFFPLLKRVIEHWKSHGDKRAEYPYYIGYLGLLVLAEYERDGRDYWAGFRDLIDPWTEGVHSYKSWVTEHVWQDLEEWSLDDRDGQLGSFTRLKIQNYEHLGPIRGQALLRRAEIEKLPNKFFDREFVPEQSPSFNELLSVAREISPRLVRWVAEVASQDELKVLERIIRGNFEAWDGNPSSDYEGQREPIGTFILTATYDSLREKLALQLRCKREDCPREGFSFQKNGSRLNAMPHSLLFSKPVVDDQRRAYSPSGTDLKQGLALRDDVGINFRLRGKSVRVFMNDVDPSIQGLVEVDEVPPNRRVWILVSSESVEEFLKLETSFENLDQLEPSNLPDGWQLYKSDGVIDSEALSGFDPIFVARKEQNLQLIGGLRSSRSAKRFMDFDPPSVEWAGRRDLIEHQPLAVFNGGECELIGHPDSDRTLWSLPANLPTEETIKIEINRGLSTEESLELSLYRSDEFGKSVKVPVIDHLGFFIETGKSDLPGFSGGRALNLKKDDLLNETLPGLIDANIVLLIGNQPDQFIDLPRKEFNHRWEPVWMVTIKASGDQLVSIDLLVADERGFPNESNTANVKAAKWKEFFKLVRIN